MLQIIKNTEYLKDYRYPVFVVPIYPDENVHPHKVVPSLFIIFSEDREPALFGIDHNELPRSFTMDDFNSLMFYAKSGSIIAKKHELLHSGLDHKSTLKDLDMLRYLEHMDIYNFLEKKPFSMVEMQRTFREYENVNKYIPMMILLEYAQKIYDDNKDTKTSSDQNDIFYHNSLLESLYFVEKNGLKVNGDILKKFYPTAAIYDNFVYSMYNPYTVTGRCSNSFGGINFAALDKESGVRKAFISRFDEEGVLIMFDYDSFHLKLLGNKFNMPYVSHKYLTNRYWPGIEITPEVYERSKQYTFAKIYGSHISAGPNHSNDAFFGEVDKKQKELMEEFENNGGWITSEYGRRIYVEKPSKEKIFNYWIQDMEFSTITFVIDSLMAEMESLESKLVLHTYDSFLFDVKLDEIKKIKALKETITLYGKYPVKIYAGRNYGEMERI